MRTTRGAISTNRCCADGRLFEFQHEETCHEATRHLWSRHAAKVPGKFGILEVLTILMVRVRLASVARQLTVKHPAVTLFCTRSCFRCSAVNEKTTQPSMCWVFGKRAS